MTEVDVMEKTLTDESLRRARQVGLRSEDLADTALRYTRSRGA